MVALQSSSSSSFPMPLPRPFLLLTTLLSLLSFISSCLPIAHSISSGPHINNLNVLLPPRTTFPVRYRLQGSDGCFTWTWDHHDILSVEPEYNATGDCSTSSTITSIAPYSGRRSTAVYATDTLTGQVIRCEVFLDMISRVQIFHHSVKLDLDGLATLRIRAFDSEDNVFSSLVGLQFIWRLVPVDSVEEMHSHSLAHVPLKDTPLSDCGCICGDIDTQIDLEQKGVGSDLFVVRGSSVGQERVVVNLFEPQLENLGDEIILTVAEAMFLEPPSPLYIITATRVQYTLKTLRHNLPSVVKLPSAHHRWSVVNSSVAWIDAYSGIVFGQMIGSTNVVVEDTRVAGHQQISSLHVVLPTSLHLYLSPLIGRATSQNAVSKRDGQLMSSDTPWYLVMDWDYVVQVLAFSQESGSQPLYLTKDNNLEFVFGDWPYWNCVSIPEDVAREQGWHNATLLKAVAEGSGKIGATLKYSNIVPEDNLSNVINFIQQVLSVEQEVIVCNPVNVISENNEGISHLILPWSLKHRQEYRLAAKGGCGKKATDYRWTSSDSTVASVSPLGIVQSKGLGKTVILVAVATNLLNFDEVMVDISAPSSIAMVEGLPVEVEVGSHLPVAISLLNAGGLRYTKCDIFGSLVHWRVFGGEGVFTLVNETTDVSSCEKVSSNPGVCAWALFLASHPGRATITAALNLEDWVDLIPSASNVLPVLEGSWVASAYLPLRLEQAGDGKSYGGYDYDVSHLQSTLVGVQSRHHLGMKELLLVPGSSMKVMLQGGPERWSPGIDFVEWHDIIPLTNEGTAIEDISVVHLISSGGRFYEITCNAIGNYTIIFHRGNSIGEGHPRPEVAKVALSLSCDIPFMITMLVDEPGNAWEQIKASSKAERDPRAVHASHVTVVNARRIRVAAVALDSSTRPFANASSLFLNWILEGCQGLAHWNEVTGSKNDHMYGSWERKLVLLDNTGQCIVRASVTFLINSKALATSVQIAALDKLKQREQFLCYAVWLQLVASLRIEPKSALLYFHPDAKASFAVVGGTGSIEFHINDSRVAIALQQFPISPFVHFKVAARDLGTAMITVQDRGLAIPLTDSALVRVADVAWVRMLLPEEASIPLGSTLTVKLQAGDIMGSVFEDSQFEFMNVRVHLQDDILELVSNDGAVKVSGMSILGSSFILRGSSVGMTNNLYVSVLPNSGREILSDFARVEVYAPLSIQPADLVLAPGAEFVVWVHGGPSTSVVVRFSTMDDRIASVDITSGLLVANDPGDVIIVAEACNHDGEQVCQASLEVKVVIPESMSLNVRGGQLGVGQEMSIFPVGTEVDLFAFFELCGDYKWTVGDELVLLLQHPDISADSFSHDANVVKREVHGLATPNTGRKGRAIDARFSSRAVGRASGKTDVTVSFTCHFHSRSGKNSFSPAFYKASDSVRVLPDPPLALGVPVTWLLPPDFVTSIVLPQLTDSFLEPRSLGSRRHVTYSVMHEGCGEIGGITLEGGYIKTSERNDLACILARDRRTGRSEVAVCVRVAEVVHITVGQKGFPFHVFDLSVGTHQLYNVIVRDHLGTPFFEVCSAVKLNVVTNRADVLSVKVLDTDDEIHSSNPGIILQALRQGTALVRVSQEGSPLVADYILVHVGAFISPRNPVFYIGRHVNFSIVGKAMPSSEEGQWSSSDEAVIQIDGDTGEAVAVGTGKAVVHFNGSRLMTYTSATVVQVTSINIKAPLGMLTNVPYPNKGYQFHVEFRDSEDHDVGVIGTGQEVTYNCRIVPSYIGRCTPWRDPDGGAYFCVFFPYAPERLFWNQQRQLGDMDASLNVRDAKGILHITVIAEVPGTSDLGGVEALFAGGFSLLDVQHELHLLPTLNRSRLTVVGSAGAVEVSWLRKDAMEVRRISNERDASGVGGHAVYEVKVFHEGKPFTDKLIFSLPSTGQQEEINVSYEAGPPAAAPLSGQIAMAVIVTVVLVVLPLIICARLLDLPRPFRVLREPQISSTMSDPDNENISDGTPVRSTRTLSALDAVQTPQHLSSRSPPQPYTDYVSRTIENTPYFRREGFRRFDPSHTY